MQGPDTEMQPVSHQPARGADPSLINVKAAGEVADQHSPATEARSVETSAAITASVVPMENPMSAAAKAARSLMPSPQNMVTLLIPWTACRL